MSESAVALACRVISMEQACVMAGTEIRGSAYVREGGVRAWCPAGEFSHSDAGRDPAMRVYPDHAWCFACARYFSPVGLCAEAWDMTPAQAAAEMLEKAGWKPENYRKRWEKLVVPEVPDQDALAAALLAWCRASCEGWEARQYDPQVAARLARCLGLLPLVRDGGECRVWLDAAKRAMLPLMEGQERPDD